MLLMMWQKNGDKYIIQKNWCIHIIKIFYMECIYNLPFFFEKSNLIIHKYEEIKRDKEAHCKYEK